MSDTRMEDALRLRRQGKLAEAAQVYGDVLQGEPRHFAALHGLGIVRYQSGQLDEAERLIGQAIEVDPGAADAHYNRGSLLLRLERVEEAIACFDSAIAVKPGYIEARMNRGIALLKCNRPDLALEDFAYVTKLKPAIAEAWVNRGGAAMKLDRYGEARESFDKALALKPDSPDVWASHGNALARLHMRTEAVASFTEALQRKHGGLEVLAWRADLLLALHKFEDAARDYRAVLAADPDYKYVLGNLAFCNLCGCDWKSLEDDKAKIAAGLEAGKKVLAPFPNLVLSGGTGDDVLGQTRRWSAEEFPASQTPLWQGERYRHERIRVAYLSANFNEHAVAQLMAGVFEHHDKSRFETIGISFGPDDGSLLRARLMRAFERFADVREKSDAETAMLLKEMEADIAVDLMGFTEGCRPGILALRPAPVQINYLGFPGTMGADYVDYILGDATVTPQNHQARYSENIVQLPHCYLPNDRARRIAQHTPSRAEAGLPERGFVFCCFNNSYKFSPATFDVWMRILRAVEGSVLWLSQVPPPAFANLRREAQARGVSPERLVLAPYVTFAEDHLARLRLADLFLDTLPYNAHTTAADALWAGLPVLTCSGETFAGCVATSLLRAVGLPEMAVESLEAYEALTVKLATDGAALSAIKTKLAANRNTQALFDTARFTRGIEAAFLAMHQRSERGEPPQGFAVAEEPVAS